MVREILSANDQVAAQNRAALDAAGVLALNLMSSPGAGKTSLILAIAGQMLPQVRLGVIEGDPASRIDTDTIAAHGIPVTQINTGGGCHLDAPMIRTTLPDLPLAAIDLLLIDDEVRGACEILGFDPLYVANEGKCLMIAAREMAEQVLEILRAHPLGRAAAIVGEVVAEHPSKVGCAAGSAASA